MRKDPDHQADPVLAALGRRICADGVVHAAAEFRGSDVDERAEEPWRWCKSAWRHGTGDRGADLVFQCRGRPLVLHEALRSLGPQGTVCFVTDIVPIAPAGG